MPNPGYRQEDLDESLRLVTIHGTVTAAAEAAGIPGTTMGNRYREAKRRAELDPGILDALEQTGISPDKAKFGYRRVQAADGQFNTVFWRMPEAERASILEQIKDAFADLPAAPAIQRPDHVAQGKVGFFPHCDIHLGSEVTADRGGQAYDPDIALARLEAGFNETHAAIPPCEVAIVLNNGDALHANDDTDATPRNKHRLKVKGTHRQNLKLTIGITAWMIDTSLERHGHVIYRANRGNHDPNAPDTLTLALIERYRDNPRVTIDESENDLWVWQKGKLFLAAHHGHGLSPEKFAREIPAKCRREFGSSDFWYYFSAHYHSQRQDTFGGIRWWQLPAICALDAHAADMGYADTAAMMAMMFDTQRGLKTALTVNL